MRSRAGIEEEAQDCQRTQDAEEFTASMGALCLEVLLDIRELIAERRPFRGDAP